MCCVYNKIRVGWVATLKTTSARWRYQVNIGRDNKAIIVPRSVVCDWKDTRCQFDLLGKNRDELREPEWMRFRGMQGAARRE